MNVQIIGSTKVGYELPIKDALKFGGMAAGVCYMPQDLDTLFSEAEEKTISRVNQTLSSGHHSVYDHPRYILAIENIPKILAMVLNNEKVYATSEKSARYTIMKPSKEEEYLYNKWIDIYSRCILKKYPNINEKLQKKLALENARYLISLFTPATSMIYSVDIRQLNYIAHWLVDFNEYAEKTLFNMKLKQVFEDFLNAIDKLIIPELNTDKKNRRLSIFDTRKCRVDEWGENYSVNYITSMASFAQAQRHRSLNYSFTFLEDMDFYIPPIIRETQYEKLWLEDISSLKELFPQGMLVKVNERGTYEKFLEKCSERLCGSAQLEIMQQTKKTLSLYLASVQNDERYKEIYEELYPYSLGARCKLSFFDGCERPCMWGPKNALNRDL